MMMMKIQTPLMSLMTLFFLIFFVSLVHSIAIISHTSVVDQSKKGNFVSIQSAIDAVPPGNSKWYKIHINPGIYKEKVTIPKDKQFIFLEGSGDTKTTITWGDYQQTDQSATFSALADNFVAKGITFKNTYNVPYKAGTKFTPALAVRVYGDKSAFYNCAFVGFQDTLWANTGRQYYKSCYIEGAVDFIWGRGQAVFEDCNIKSMMGSLPHYIGFITAQGRQSSSDPGGFVFIKGTITGSGKSYLGRAYGPYSRVLFYQTSMENFVQPLGWDAWNQKGNENNFMHAEVSCSGPGANPSKRASWVKKKVDGPNSAMLSTKNFIDQDGWLAKQP